MTLPKQLGFCGLETVQHHFNQAICKGLEAEELNSSAFSPVRLKRARLLGQVDAHLQAMVLDDGFDQWQKQPIATILERPLFFNRTVKNQPSGERSWFKATLPQLLMAPQLLGFSLVSERLNQVFTQFKSALSELKKAPESSRPMIPSPFVHESQDTVSIVKHRLEFVQALIEQLFQPDASRNYQI